MPAPLMEPPDHVVRPFTVSVPVPLIVPVPERLAVVATPETPSKLAVPPDTARLFELNAALKSAVPSLTVSAPAVFTAALNVGVPPETLIEAGLVIVAAKVGAPPEIASVPVLLTAPF